MNTTRSANGGRRLVLVLLMGAFFVTMTARLIVSPLVPRLTSVFGVTKGTIGGALTGMWAAYAVTQLPAGILANRYDERPFVLVALATICAGSLLLAVAPSYRVFALAVVVIGVGSGVYLPTAASLLTRLFENTGQVLGLHISGGDSAGLVAPVAATTVAAAYGWRPALGLGAVVGLPVLLLCTWRLRPEPRETDGPERSLREVASPSRLLGLLAGRKLLFTTALGVCLMFTFQAVVSFFPTFLVEYWAVGTGRASTLFALVFLLWIVNSPVAGRLSDRFGHDVVLFATSTSMLVGLVFLVRSPTFAGALVGTVLLGTGMSWGGVLASRLMAYIPASDRTAGYGMVRSLYVLLGSAGSVVTGTLAERAGWAAAYGLVAVLLLAVALSLGGNRLLDLEL
jgi:predicted MFS family arabinose efflux permease